MLDFIVLGQVPGTDIYIPFEYVILGLTITIIIVLSYKLVSPFKHYKKRMQKIFDSSI